MLPCHVKVSASREGLERIWLLPPQAEGLSWSGDPTHRRTFEQWLDEYAAGKQPTTQLPLNYSLSPFAKRVLQTLLVIPFGETITYGKLADAAGHPKAARAVGSVMNANPFPLVIPCHRVVASNGIGGFALGLEMKRALLKHETPDCDLISPHGDEAQLFRAEQEA